MTSTVNTIWITILTVFFVCARVYLKETAVVFLTILFFLCLTPFL